jgi:hypothetical protein
MARRLAYGGFLGKFSGCGGVEIFVGTDKTARKSPRITERRDSASDQKHPQIVVNDGHDDDVDSNGEWREGVRVVVAEGPRIRWHTASLKQ